MDASPWWAAVAPLVVLALAVDVGCLIDLWRRGAPAHLPRWAWTVIVLVSFPLGPLAYLWLGRRQESHRDHG
jgi:hypothetical protein